MARIRTIKPAIWTDNAFIELGHEARLLLIGMITQADDDGRLIASSSALIGAVYPHDDVTAKQVERWREELVGSGIVRVYSEGRGTYAVFPNWNRHQVINKRSPSTLPTPPDTGVLPTHSGSAPVVVQELPQGNYRPEVEVEVEVEKGERKWK